MTDSTFKPGVSDDSSESFRGKSEKKLGRPKVYMIFVAFLASLLIPLTIKRIGSISFATILWLVILSLSFSTLKNVGHWRKRLTFLPFLIVTLISILPSRERLSEFIPGRVVPLIGLVLGMVLLLPMLNGVTIRQVYAVVFRYSVFAAGIALYQQVIRIPSNSRTVGTPPPVCPSLGTRTSFFSLWSD